jgi:uncharacterized protein YndB with AHSA1/START domain
MASPVSSPATSLHIRRVFNASRERLFQAWTDPNKMTEWFCHAKPELIGQLVVMDVRPGGRYGFDISDADGRVFKVRGEYLEIKAPEKLVFTWFWETEPEYGDTVVTLEFVDLGEKSELIMTHERFANSDARDKHNSGWAFCLDSLQRSVEKSTGGQ